jgi:hypothetical protein
MLPTVRKVLPLIALSAAMMIANRGASAATIPTILEMSLGDATTDIRFDGTNLFTEDDAVAGTTGNQNTGILFLNFLAPVHPDILTSTASFTMTGLQKQGQAILVANTTTIVQTFNGGSFALYDDLNNLLLSGNLSTSALSGALNVSTGGLFTTSSVSVTGGSLQSYVDPTSVQVSMNFTSIERAGGVVGLGLTPAPSLLPPLTNYLADLIPFTADSTVNAEAKAVPEPATIALLALCAGAIGAVRRRR